MCRKYKKILKKKGWVINFIDEFEFFNDKNWQDQLLWVNDEDQCYVEMENSILVKLVMDL